MVVSQPRTSHLIERQGLDFYFCLSTSIPVLTTSTYVVAWPQGDQLLGGGPWHKANLPAAHWLSLPFHTSEGAWPLSQSTWVQRWSSSLQTVVVTPPERKLASCCHHQDSSIRCLCPLSRSLPPRAALLTARKLHRPIPVHLYRSATTICPAGVEILFLGFCCRCRASNRPSRSRSFLAAQ